MAIYLKVGRKVLYSEIATSGIYNWEESQYHLVLLRHCHNSRSLCLYLFGRQHVIVPLLYHDKHEQLVVCVCVGIEYGQSNVKGVVTSLLVCMSSIERCKVAHIHGLPFALLMYNQETPILHYPHLLSMLISLPFFYEFSSFITPTIRVPWILRAQQKGENECGSRDKILRENE